MRTGRSIPSLVAAAVMIAALAADVRSQDAKSAPAAQSAVAEKSSWVSEALAGMAKGTAFLKSRQKNGVFEVQGKPEPGVTALALAAMLSSPDLEGGERESLTRPGLEYLASLKKPDGGIYAEGMANYVTASAILAFAASGDPKHRPLIEGARKFLVGLQRDEADGISPTDAFYGGTGYGSDGRPDLSNMNLWMDGVAAAGLPKGDDAYRKALLFLSRCQNQSETNKLEYQETVDGASITWVAGNDGGAFYKPGESKAGFVELPDGKRVPRSYGSMTYALLKCYLLAGLPKDDARLKAAVGWIQKNYTLEENPGFDTRKDPNAGYQGLFYYYLTLGQALSAFGEETLTDAKGGAHRWREELTRAILSRQNPDGSWANSKDRWWEAVPELVTSYAVLTLKTCVGKS